MGGSGISSSCFVRYPALVLAPLRATKEMATTPSADAGGGGPQECRNWHLSELACAFVAM